METTTETHQSLADHLHWSFSDGPNLTKVVFPTGFSSSESTFPSGNFDPLSDWEQAYDVVFPGYSNTPSPSAAPGPGSPVYLLPGTAVSAGDRPVLVSEDQAQKLYGSGDERLLLHWTRLVACLEGALNGRIPAADGLQGRMWRNGPLSATGLCWRRSRYCRRSKCRLNSHSFKPLNGLIGDRP